MVPLAVTATSAGNVLLLVFNGCFASFIVAANLSVFLSMVLSESFRGENRFLYMMSTCVSDFLTGAAWFYLGLYDVKDYFPGKNSTRFVAPTFLGLSYLVIVAAQADRCHAVLSPIKYSQRMTPGKTVLVIVCLWLYASAILAASNLESAGVAVQMISYGGLISNTITVAIMVGLNIRLYHIARYQLEREPPTAQREAKRSSLYLIIVVAASFLILWAPVFLRIYLCQITALRCQPASNEATDPFTYLPRINTALTPLWYIRGCRPLRERLYGWIRKLCVRCHL
ncbi:histamine H2 receptor-like [Ambystoma mexicanum]|uniref:histamine H2 receptor-like n=1 Tax=Ambystoma mexicanum TaxID=8296 RepID=UPI0037E92F3A